MKWRAFDFNPFKLVMEARVSSKQTLSMRNGNERKLHEDERFNNGEVVKASSCHHNKMEMGRRSARVEAKSRKRQPGSITPNQASLKQEILHLQAELQHQFAIRNALEKALSCQPFSCDTKTENSVPKGTMELIKEISVLELEVVYLEQHLLSLYRKTFDQSIPSFSTVEERPKPKQCNDVSEEQNMFDSSINHRSYSSLSLGSSSIINSSLSRQFSDVTEKQNMLDSSINQRSYSSLSHCSGSIMNSPQSKSLAKALDSYHSLPLSMLENSKYETTSLVTLPEHFERYTLDQVVETPNMLSEEMIKCIAAIYCELVDRPLIRRINHPSSPISFSSSVHDSHYPFVQIRDFEEQSDPYCTMFKIQSIYRDKQKLEDISHMLQKFRSLVYRLGDIDPTKMKHDEKLAFWINVHNSLVMHAFLVYGIPKNNLKRMSLLLKADYNVGGEVITIDTIQSTILGCRLPRPGQWLQLLFSLNPKLKPSDPVKGFAIDHHEPLLYFALCSGNNSDPAVRVYTAKRLYEEMEAAKEEYIKSTLVIHKEHKLLVPKIVESFAKVSGLCSSELVKLVDRIIPHRWQKSSVNPSRHKKTMKGIEWIPHDFAFGFVLSNDLSSYSTLM